MRNMKSSTKLAIRGVEPSAESRQSICFPSQVLISLNLPPCEFVSVALPGNSRCIAKVSGVGSVSSLASLAAPLHAKVYPVVASLCVTDGTWDGSTQIVSLEDVKLLKECTIHSIRVKAYLNSPQAIQHCKKKPNLFLKVIEKIISLYGVVSGCLLKCRENELAQTFGVNTLMIYSVKVVSKESNIPKNIDFSSDSVAFSFCKDVPKSVCFGDQCDCGWKRCSSNKGSKSFHRSNGCITLCGVEILEEDSTLALHSWPTEFVEKAMQKEATFLQNILFRNSNFYKKGLVLLLTGLSGCGKSSLVRCIATKSCVPFTSVDCRQLRHDSNFGVFSHILEELPSERPCIVLLQRLDQLFSSAKKSQNLLIKVALCISQCEAMGVSVIITAQDRSALPADLVSRVAHELTVGASTVLYRYAVLESLLGHSELLDVLHPLCTTFTQPNGSKPVEAVDEVLTVNKGVCSTPKSQFSSNEMHQEVLSTSTPLQSDFSAVKTSARTAEDDICYLAAEIANITPGCVAQDLQDFVMLIEAKLLKQASTRKVTTEAVWKAACEEVTRLKPRVLRNSELLGDRPGACPLGGMQMLQLQLSDVLGAAVSAGRHFAQLGLLPTRGILLYGPPGCGKTQLMCSLAASQGFSFFAVQPKHVLSPYVGESEQKLMAVFQTARKTRPSIIFFDEIDGVFGDRCEGGSEASKRLVTELLQALNGANAHSDGSDMMDGLLVCGATNNPHKLDAALLRPGRFDRVIYVPPPNAHQRLEILQTKCQKLSLENPDALAELAEQTEYFTGADLEGIVQEATTRALLTNSFTAAGGVFVTSTVLRQICCKTKPKVTPDLLRMYEAFLSSSTAL